MATATAKPTDPTPPPEQKPTPNIPDEITISAKAIVDDDSFDWGTRFRPDRTTPIGTHLGGMPTTVESLAPRLDEPLPSVDPEKAVIPAANVPLEILVQKLVDKALSDKDKSELTASEVHPSVPSLTTEEAEAAAKADAEATKAAQEDVKTTS